jgi:hypothetical protein
LRIVFGPIPAAILEASFYAVRRNCSIPLSRQRKAEKRPESLNIRPKPQEKSFLYKGKMGFEKEGGKGYNLDKRVCVKIIFGETTMGEK